MSFVPITETNTAGILKVFIHTFTKNRGQWSFALTFVWSKRLTNSVRFYFFTAVRVGIKHVRRKLNSNTCKMSLKVLSRSPIFSLSTIRAVGMGLGKCQVYKKKIPNLPYTQQEAVIMGLAKSATYHNVRANDSCTLPSLHRTFFFLTITSTSK